MPIFVVPLIYAFIDWLLYVPRLGIEPATVAYGDDTLANRAAHPVPFHSLLDGTAQALRKGALMFSFAFRETVWVSLHPVVPEYKLITSEIFCKSFASALQRSAGKALLWIKLRGFTPLGASTFMLSLTTQPWLCHDSAPFGTEARGLNGLDCWAGWLCSSVLRVLMDYLPWMPAASLCRISFAAFNLQRVLKANNWAY